MKVCATGSTFVTILNCTLITTVWAVPLISDGRDNFHLRELDILNTQSQTADETWRSNLGVERGAKECSTLIPASYEMLRRPSDLGGRPKQWKCTSVSLGRVH